MSWIAPLHVMPWGCAALQRCYNGQAPSQWVATFLLIAAATHMTPHVQVVHAWLPQLLKEHKVSTITTTGHSLGGGLATLCALDVAQHLDQNWARWDKTGWKTKQRPQVRLVTYASPRLGNATFVDTFHKLGIAALRIENKGDLVPDVPGVCVCVAGRSKYAALCGMATYQKTGVPPNIDGSLTAYQH